jgi:hypothetical protein
MEYHTKTFWRLNYATEAILENMVSSSSVITPASDFVLGLKVGDAILLARFDENIRAGVVRAIGIFFGVDPATSLPVVNWTRISDNLYPTTQGQRFWRQAKPYFKFAKDLVARYRLTEMLAKNQRDVVINSGIMGIKPHA